MSNILRNNPFEYFSDSAKRFESNIALELSGRVYTYEEILGCVERLASVIAAALGSGGVVGIYSNRSLSDYVGILAVLKSDNAYVPLSASLSVERNRTIVARTRISVVVCDYGSAEILRTQIGFAGAILVVNSDASINCLAKEEVAIAREAASSGLAYVMFTSGSTGIPKGVMVTKANVVAYMEHIRSRYAFTSDDKIAQVSDLTFDLSVFDLFVAWAHGARLCVPQKYELAIPHSFIRNKGITVWLSVPSYISLMRRAGTLKSGIFPSLKWSFFCGEALAYDGVADWAKAAPGSYLENLYGPTELTVSCAFHRIDRADLEDKRGIVPLGSPHANQVFTIVDQNMEEVADGDIGELCVSGAQNFRGYWDDGAATARACFRSRGAPAADTYYRTGDLVFRNSTGGYEFVGRADSQVKVNGYRIELGDVESELRTLPNVVDAVALAVSGIGEQPARIIAFVTGATDSLGLLQAAKLRLPVYMVPSSIHCLAEFTLNANGKIDRKSLQMLAETLEGGS